MRDEGLFSLFVLGSLILSLSVVSADGTATEGSTVFRCGTITTSGVYTMNQSIVNNSLTTDCVIISAENVSLNCDNYFISSDDNEAGLYSNQDNTTITNCNISMGSEYGGIGIKFDNVDNSSVHNLTTNFTYRGIYLYYSDGNLLSNITASNSNENGVYLSFSDNNTISNITASNSNKKGVFLSRSDNNTISNIIANSNKNGVGLFYSNGNLLSNITASNSNENGVYFSNSEENNLTKITANSNGYGIYFDSSSNNNTLSNATVNSNGVRGLYFSSDSNNSISNINFKDNLQNNIVNTSSLREVEVNNEISLNFYVAHLNETINSNFEYNIAIYPNVSYETSTNSNVLILNFTPIKQGVYTIKLNISDSENNLEQSNFLFLIGDTSSDLVRYYLHEDEPTHGQPLATTNYDSGSMFTYPTESEEERHCGSWVQYQPDKITNFYPIIKNISLGLFYTASLSISSGLQNYATYGIDMDYIQALPVSSDYFFNITNFIDLNISSDYSWRLYWLAFKLGEISASPSVKSNATQQSYADLTYVYAGPKIEQFSEESGSDMRNVEILSSVFNDITKKKCYLGI